MTNELHHLAAAYALDALSEDERRQFEAHYPSCSVCSGEVSDFRETAAVLALGASATPPADLKRNVMAEIAQTRQISPLLPDGVVDLAEQRRRKVANRPRILAAVAAALVVVVGTVAALGLRPGSTDDITVVLAAPDAQTLELVGSGPGSVRVVWSPTEDEAVILGSDFDAPGAGRDYVLWLIDGDGANPTGLFEPDEDGLVEARFELNGRSPAAWGITNEPDGGSPQPTTDILYVGETA